MIRPLIEAILIKMKKKELSNPVFSVGSRVESLPSFYEGVNGLIILFPHLFFNSLDLWVTAYHEISWFIL